MKLSITSILILFFVQPLKISAQRNFASQGEQENYWATELFKNSYLKQNFKRFNGKITELGHYQIKYDSTILKIFTSNQSIKQIFVSGIFYPGIFDDPRTLDPSIKNIRLSTSDSTEKIQKATKSSFACDDQLQDSFRNDTVSISIIEEIPFLSESPKVKRFRMWVNSKWMVNPTIYFFELTNNKATGNTNLSDFIKDAILTFVRKGWLII